MGYQDPATGIVNMVGYIITNAGQWQESTNLQDEEHLVQIASPSSSDRFGRYPQVSQGDWSGGERQEVFVTANQYYSSSQLNTSVPGHLTILGNYSQYTIPNGVQAHYGVGLNLPGYPRSVLAGTISVFFIGTVGGTAGFITQLNLQTQAVTAVAFPGTSIGSEMLQVPDGTYVATASGVYKYTVAGGFVQVTNDPITEIHGASLAYFGGSVYYITGGNSPNTLNSATYPFPGASAGTVNYTANQMEDLLQAVVNSATGLVFATGSPNGSRTYLYGFDGVNANLFGILDGVIQDMVEANGTVYILTQTPRLGPIITGCPVIYSLSGSTISIFDDYRLVATDFQPTVASGNGHLATDGTYLYLFTAGLSTKRYRLTTSAVYDVGNSAAFDDIGPYRAGAPLVDGSFVEINPARNPTTAWVCLNGAASVNVNGSLTTSWFDFDVPSVRKSFSAIEFIMNTNPDPTALTVEYETDVLPGFMPVTVGVSLSQDTLIAYLPLHTIATRIRFQITLNYGANEGAPDVQLYAVSGKLTRVWQVPVACRREQGTRTGQGNDSQNLTPMQLLANIQNAYDLASGNVVLYIPDPTIDQNQLNLGNGVALGVSQVNAVLQDYQRTTGPGTAPGYRQTTDGGAYGMESDVTLILSGSL